MEENRTVVLYLLPISPGSMISHQVDQWQTSEVWGDELFVMLS